MACRKVSLDDMPETEFITSSEDDYGDNYDEDDYQDYDEHSLLLHTSENQEIERSNTRHQLGLKAELTSTWLELPTLPDVEDDIGGIISASNHEQLTIRVENPEILLLLDLVEEGNNYDEDGGYSDDSELGDEQDFYFETLRYEKAHATPKVDDFWATTEQAVDRGETISVPAEGTTNTTVCETTGCENLCFKCEECTKFDVWRNAGTNQPIENKELEAWSSAIQARFLGPQQKFTMNEILERIQLCKKCHLKFSTREEALKHHNVVHGEKLCPACLLYFPTKQLTARLHFIQCHAENRKDESAECPVLGCRKKFYLGLYHHLGKAHLCKHEKILKAEVSARAQERRNKLNKKFKLARFTRKPKTTFTNRIHHNAKDSRNNGNRGAYIKERNVAVKETSRSEFNGTTGVSDFAKERQKSIGITGGSKTPTYCPVVSEYQSTENSVYEVNPTLELETAVATSNNLMGYKTHSTPDNIISKTSVSKSKQSRSFTNFRPKIRGVDSGYLDFCTQDPKQWVESELKRKASSLADLSYAKKAKRGLQVQSGKK